MCIVYPLADATIALTITPSKPLAVLLGVYIPLNCSPILPIRGEITYTWTHFITSTVLEDAGDLWLLRELATVT